MSAATQPNASDFEVKEWVEYHGGELVSHRTFKRGTKDSGMGRPVVKYFIGINASIHDDIQINEVWEYLDDSDEPNEVYAVNIEEDYSNKASRFPTYCITKYRIEY